MKLLIHPPVDGVRFDRICAAAAPMTAVNAADDAAALAEIADADAFFGKITPVLLAAAKKLRWIQSPTASLEHYVFPELIEHPVVLSNMRGIYSDVIADHVLGYITCFARNLHVYIRQMAAGQWQPYGGGPILQPFATGPADDHPGNRSHRRLADCSLGVVGLGHIGVEIARRGIACGMRVVAVDPRQTVAPEGVEALWPPERLDDLLGESDFVVIAAPHTPATEKLFYRSRFEAMRRSAVLVNIGRGAIVDLADLTAALEEGLIAGAALDVCEIEPLPADHPLWRMPNVIITPHVAAFSQRIPERHVEMTLENIRRFAKGEPVMNVVDKAMWF
ncbi:MAG: D-2-hydroxyacid dehydrogenase [Pirellulales bacterium]